MAKQRLDQRVLELGFAESREKARTLIMSGAVFLGGRRLDKPGMMIPMDSLPEVRGQGLQYVSRGGLKLEKALQVFPVTAEGKVCLDCGASTGGFTDVLLQNGAQKVYAVDVGYGQLAWKLRQDERVVNLERTNARTLTPEQFPLRPDLTVMDVSFISIRLILPVIRPFLKTSADYICLIKPQFEAGREQVGKKGVVRDPTIHREVIAQCLQAAEECGYSIRGLDYSPIRGPEGNIEFLCHLNQESEGSIRPDIDAVVTAAHQEKL